MNALYKILGKVSPTADGYWDKSKQYDRICIVVDKNTATSYISRKEVPAGTPVTDREYWQVIGTEGGAVSIDIDKELTKDSVNAVESKAIYNKFTEVINRIDEQDSDIATVKTNIEVINTNLNKVMEQLFPFKVNAVISQTTAEKGEQVNLTITITTTQGGEKVSADSIFVNGNEYHGDNPMVLTFVVTDTTTYYIKAEKDGVSASTTVTIKFNTNVSDSNLYFGAVSDDFDITEANIKELNSKSVSNRNIVVISNLNNQKFVIAYPKEFGNATAIKDENGFNYLRSYTLEEINIDGDSYYVYILTYPTTIDNFEQTIY